MKQGWKKFLILMNKDKEGKMLIFPWMLATSLTLSMYLLTAVDRSEVGYTVGPWLTPVCGTHMDQVQPTTD